MELNSKAAAERNAGIDILKYVCAFLVICIHIFFQGRHHVEPLIRSAVPAFFMITGWFYSDDRARQKKQILRILKIFIAACGFYLLLGLADAAVHGGSAAKFMAQLFSLKAAAKFVLFNHVGIEIHLWYLAALVYVLIIAAAAGERGRQRLCWLVPLLVAASLLLGAYSPVLLGRKLPNYMGRNFLFTGLPCFLTGELLRRNRHRLRLSPALVLVLLGLSMALAILERNFIEARTGYEGADLYLGSWLMAVAMLLLAGTGERPAPGRLGRTLALWGRDYSLGVYVLHMALIWLTELLLGPLFSRSYLAAKIYYCSAPLIILLLTTALTALLKAAQRRLIPQRAKS